VTKPNKVTQVGQPQRCHTSPPLPPPRGLDLGLPGWSQACQCLGGGGLCAMSSRSSGVTGLELRLYPCTVLGGGVDGGAATRAGHLLPGLLVTRFGKLKVRSLSRRELPEG